MIPTYAVGEPEKNPMFFEKRVYQGSSGVVYPNPVIEKIHDEKQDKPYEALFIENRYLKIMILPELGGRIQMAYDKLKQRHFIYYNQVIKPALVGLCGPWISGGIEFNWPQHHRPSTFEPVDYHITEQADGSKTIWVSEVEAMFQTKGMAGFTLYEDKAYLEIDVKLFNRTHLPQTFLWWANPAVKVNDHYQSVFPPDVHAVFDHGKRDVSTFPIAKGVYYKVDYAPGTDISRYKNIPVPTSYMAVNSAYDFVGGYEHDTGAGVLHVADHHVSPGKKQWTWGNGDFGLAWDKNLTDTDGPYIELMTGVYTDNQPDFTWLMPFEEKTFKQYFLPYRELGLVSNASKDLLLRAAVADHQLQVQVFATSLQEGLSIQASAAREVIWRETATVSPETIFTATVPWPAGVADTALEISIEGGAGQELLYFSAAVATTEKPVPAPAAPAKLPAEIAQNEQLFLTGQHLEQYRHATYSPVPYYEEALRRDVGDVRCNNALGLWYLRRGQFAQSEPYFRQAITTITQRNPNPYDGEPYYNLGLCLYYQERYEAAYDAFFKAAWSSAWQDAAYYFIAQLDILQGKPARALSHINWAIDRNARNNRAYTVKCQALRQLGRMEETISTAEYALQRDAFNLSALYELYLGYQETGHSGKADTTLTTIRERSRGQASNLIAYALDYMGMGLYTHAVALISLASATQLQQPLTQYYLGYCHHKAGAAAQSADHFRRAAAADAGHSFPNRLQDIAVLQTAIRLNEQDAKAHYFLGNLFYDKKQYELAIDHWLSAAAKDAAFPTVQRNLGIAFFNKRQDPAAARTYLETAFRLDQQDARVLMELDQLYKRLNVSPATRLELLTTHQAVARERDDLYLEMAALHNFLGHHDTAYTLLQQRKFHPWEGGEGKVSGQYVLSLVELAKQAIREGQPAAALDHLENARQYPDNLGEGKLFGARENDIFYWMGVAHQQAGNDTQATICWNTAAEGNAEPGAAIYYNDQQPDKLYYQGLACKAVGQETAANTIFEKLLAYGQEHENDEIRIDYFAVSLPNLLIFDDDLGLRNKIHCKYLLGLGYLGLEQYDKSAACLQEVLALDNMHSGAQVHLQLLQYALSSTFVVPKP